MEFSSTKTYANRYDLDEIGQDGFDMINKMDYLSINDLKKMSYKLNKTWRFIKTSNLFGGYSKQKLDNIAEHCNINKNLIK